MLDTQAEGGCALAEAVISAWAPQATPVRAMPPSIHATHLS
jgi:hypothetical protein